ncbi:MAG TPA: ABC transporter ATP-binding protein [Thermodesulfobacteriota bacterium]
MTGNMIEASGLVKTFATNGSTVSALKGIDLEIKKGETLAVVGVSGSGKSTLLHILGTLDRPTEGAVFYEGQDVFNKNDGELAVFRNRQIGFVFQFHYLLPEFSALENVMMPPLIQRMELKKAREAATEILERVGLGERLSHRPGELSGGEQQRVAIARAIVLKPKVILADEPTGNLDLETGQSILDLFLKLNKEEGLTLILVTHNPSLAMRLRKRIKLLDGRIVDEG